MTTEVRYDLTASPTLDRFFNARRKPIEWLMGPFGSGKTVAMFMKAIALSHEMPPCRDGIRRARWAVVRNTYKQLEDTTMRTLFTWLPPAHWGKYVASHHTYTVSGFKDVEIEFIFRALDRPEHVQNLLSLELSHAMMNEARELPGEIIGPLWGRVGRFPPRADCGPFQRRMLGDTNPPDDENWYYKLAELDRPDNMEFYRQPGGLIQLPGHPPRFEANPKAENLRHLPDDYYTAMVGVMSQDELKVYACGEYGVLSSGKPVYPEYVDSFHCREFEIPKNTPVLRLWDFGLTPAAVFITVMPNGQVRVFDEVCAERAGIKAFAPVVKMHTTTQWPWVKDRLLRDVGDPAGDTPSQTDETSCFQIMQAEGIDIESGQQDLVLRLESVRYLLMRNIDGEPALLIHPRCKRLRKGFQGEYKYRRILTGGSSARYAVTPDKNKFSHPHDALQYGAVELVGDVVRGLGLKPGETRQTQAVSDFDPVRDNVRPVEFQHAQAFSESDFDPRR